LDSFRVSGVSPVLLVERDVGLQYNTAKPDVAEKKLPFQIAVK
jgi:hypothetical protein